MAVLQTGLEPGETVLKSGRANLQRGAETVGGHLHLTAQRLIFESHSLNLQRGSTVLHLRDVKSVSKTWTRFLNVIPLAPNSILVCMRDGAAHRLVCSGRGEWIAAIEDHLSP